MLTQLYVQPRRRSPNGDRRHCISLNLALSFSTWSFDVPANRTSNSTGICTPHRPKSVRTVLYIRTLRNACQVLRKTHSARTNWARLRALWLPYNTLHSPD